MRSVHAPQLTVGKAMLFCDQKDKNRQEEMRKPKHREGRRKLLASSGVEATLHQKIQELLLESEYCKKTGSNGSLSSCRCCCEGFHGKSMLDVWKTLEKLSVLKGLVDKHPEDWLCYEYFCEHFWLSPRQGADRYLIRCSEGLIVCCNFLKHLFGLAQFQRFYRKHLVGEESFEGSVPEIRQRRRNQQYFLAVTKAVIKEGGVGGMKQMKSTTAFEEHKKIGASEKLERAG